MKLRILVTGKNKRIAVSISEHLEDDQGYEVATCEADERLLTKAYRENHPEIAILCLNSETQTSVMTFDVLADLAEGKHLDIIVVAHDEDLQAFEAYSRLRDFRLLPRPVSILKLYAILMDIEHRKGIFRTEKKPAPDFEFEEENLTPRKQRILVVDDDPEQLAQIREHLQDFYEVVLARSGAIAFKYLENHEADLMLLDYIMPEMDGPTVLYRMRTTRALANMPVVFLTGVAEREKVVKTLTELRPQGYIIKPAKKSDIIAKIIDVLG